LSLVEEVHGVGSGLAAADVYAQQLALVEVARRRAVIALKLEASMGIATRVAHDAIALYQSTLVELGRLEASLGLVKSVPGVLVVPPDDPMDRLARKIEAMETSEYLALVREVLPSPQRHQKALAWPPPEGK
jgi:hypothetical protein